jgi:cyclopropane-fatty-acyl-phospholipid synthase
MNAIVLHPQPGSAARLLTTRFPRTARWALRLLAAIHDGRVSVTFPDGQRATFGKGPPHAVLTLANWNVFHAALRRGDVGFAETYLDGDWSTPDPVTLLVVLLRNRAAIERLVYGSWMGGLLDRLRHLANRNTHRRAKKNIHAHYDLGNDFYAAWLDPSLTYSGAWFDNLGDPYDPADGATLEAAQQAKYARVLAALDLTPDARLLEIGCGWGGFAGCATAAGHRVRGLTLSRAQLDFARRRTSSVHAEFCLQDYRDEAGQYDGIASIEMFEAVGAAYWPQYFATLARCLKPGARACIQTIVIADALFPRYRRGTDFIQQYIFPGGMLPSPAIFEQQAAAAGLRVVGRFAFGLHYAKTLRTWRARFETALPTVRALGFDNRFVALWTFYLAYCEAAFAQGNTDVVQFTLARS